MHRRTFLSSALKTAAIAAAAPSLSSLAASPRPPVHPFDVGLKVSLGDNPEGPIKTVAEMGFKNIFFSLDAYIGKYTPALAARINTLLDHYALTATAAEVVGPGRLEWNFIDGPVTIGVVPRETRAARIDALKQTSDFAARLGIPSIQTHCGFIPENPRDVLYPETVAAITELAKYCAGNKQNFLMETGQETPTTMLRVIADAAQPNLGVGLDTANLILYGKADPVVAVQILGPYIRNTHMKDGLWPTGPRELGKEVLIGTGDVRFREVVAGLKKAGYTGPLTIERETSGPQQIADVKKEKVYLEKTVHQVLNA